MKVIILKKKVQYKKLNINIHDSLECLKPNKKQIF